MHIYSSSWLKKCVIRFNHAYKNYCVGHYIKSSDVSDVGSSMKIFLKNST